MWKEYDKYCKKFGGPDKVPVEYIDSIIAATLEDTDMPSYIKNNKRESPPKQRPQTNVAPKKSKNKFFGHEDDSDVAAFKTKVYSGQQPKLQRERNKYVRPRSMFEEEDPKLAWKKPSRRHAGQAPQVPKEKCDD